MATEKTATATWEGTLAEGSGTFSLGTGVVSDQAVTWADRAEGGSGTSPEELIAAAHASCILMALAGALVRAGAQPQRMESEARATFDKVGEGFAITTMEISIRAQVDGIDDEGFREAAEGAKENCPVSQALKGNVEVTLDATLL
jgi:osmotically inducible protein OsmC